MRTGGEELCTASDVSVSGDVVPLLDHAYAK